MIRYLAIAATLALLPVQALSMQKCVDDEGNITFTDGACPSGAAGKAYQPSNATMSSGSGLRPGERALLNDVRAKDAEDRYYKRKEYQHDRRHTLTFGDRKRIRELEMEKRSLSKSLTRGSKSWSQNISIRDQIRGIDRQIEQIRSPKY